MASCGHIPESRQWLFHNAIYNTKSRITQFLYLQKPTHYATLVVNPLHKEANLFGRNVCAIFNYLQTARGRAKLQTMPLKNILNFSFQGRLQVL
jgi:hypothetical protein